MSQFSSSIITSINDIPGPAWDACAGVDNPFVAHAFFAALEQSGSATRETGWLPQHVIVQDAAGAVAGVMPLYLKSHSYGEYVFDHGWAEAFERAGGRYYPKLQSSVPFTPVTGPRLMAHPDFPQNDVRKALLKAATDRAQELGVSSLHLTFLREDEWQLAGQSGFLQRTDQQFHWENRGYAHFADFLAELSSRKRKMITKERREAVANDITIEQLTGSQITEAHWDAYFDFYVDTGNRKWGRPYLNRQFFSLLGEGLSDRILLVMCKRAGRYIAGALNLIGADSLYGRYWGAIEEHRFLHFEVCYYQAINFAIERGLKRVEAGAQGEHKLARGYLPSKTFSAHWIADAGFRGAVENFLERERVAVDRNIEILNDYAPFRHAEDTKE
jgi:predicted N-acyltransferase